MSNLPQQNTINQYQADGMTVSYVYSYLILLDSDISVYVTPAGQPANPSTDLQVLGTDYNVTGAGVPTGGTVVFVVAPASGDVVTLVRTIQISIDTEFSLAQNFNGANLDTAFERVTLFTQQTNTLLNQRALQFVVDTFLPNENANQVPPLADGQVWSGLGGAIVATTIETNADLSLLRSQLASQAPLAEGALLVGYYDTIQGLGTTVAQYLDYKDVFGFDSGAADVMVLTIPNSNFRYANGQAVHVIVANTNLTTTPTININGKGAVVIKRNPTSAAQAGDLLAGAVVDLIFDSVNNCFYISNLFISSVSLLTPTAQQFTSGSGTYTTPAGALYIDVFGVGGGASGGGTTGTGGSNVGAGSGGSAGGYFMKRIISPSATYPYVVGAGAASGSAGNVNGNNGNVTTFGTALLVANGGLAGLGSRSISTVVVGGQSGGTATGGDINIRGGSGGSGMGANATVGGFGGASQLSGSVAGPYISTSGNTSNGNAGFNYGGGGSGAAQYGGGVAFGGAGAGGIIRVIEYYS